MLFERYYKEIEKVICRVRDKFHKACKLHKELLKFRNKKAKPLLK